MRPVTEGQKCDSTSTQSPEQSVAYVRSTEGSLAVARGRRRGDGSSCLTGTEFAFGKMKKFWRRMVMTVARQCEC